jgi:phenylacetate-coenzyme A ligase PaaK-like adenylate-forming protein
MAGGTLPDYDVGDPALNSLPREELRRIQDERLRAMVPYVHATSGFWRRTLDEAGVAPEDVRGVADLRLLPLVVAVAQTGVCPCWR